MVVDTVVRIYSNLPLSFLMEHSYSYLFIQLYVLGSFNSLRVFLFIDTTILFFPIPINNCEWSHYTALLIPFFLSLPSILSFLSMFYLFDDIEYEWRESDKTHRKYSIVQIRYFPENQMVRILSKKASHSIFSSDFPILRFLDWESRISRRSFLHNEQFSEKHSFSKK